MTTQRTKPRFVSTNPTTNIPTDPIKIITEGAEPKSADPIMIKEDSNIKDKS